MVVGAFVVVVVGAAVVVAATVVVGAAVVVAPVVVVVVGATVPNFATLLATLPTAHMLPSGPTVRPFSPNELGAG